MERRPDYVSSNPTIQFFCMDCMDFMRHVPDGYYDLAIVDPPYGIGVNNMDLGGGKHRGGKRWDNAIPDASYFRELFRVSRHQVIWGANYFVEHLTEGHRGWIVWDKGQYGLSFSDFEVAYSSFDCPARMYIANRVALLKEGTIQPAQKPIGLYRWILKNYAEKGWRILDTHGGSMSIAIACDMEGFELDICEIDREYFDAALNRFINHKRQLRLFDSP